MALSIGRAWIDTMAVVQRRAGAFALPAAAFVFLPGLVAGRYGDSAHVGTAAAGAFQLVAGLIGVLGQAAVVALVLAPAADVGAAIRRAAATAPRIVIASLGVLVVLLPSVLAVEAYRRFGTPMLGLLALILAAAALYMSSRLSMLAPAVIAEDATAAQALRRSWRLTAGHAARILALIVLILIGFVLVSAVVAAAGTLVSGGSARDPSFLTELLLAAAGAAFSVVFGAATANLYLQLTPLQNTAPSSRD